MEVCVEKMENFDGLEIEEHMRGEVGWKTVKQEVQRISEHLPMKRTDSGKASGPDEAPVELWRHLGESAVGFLSSLFNTVL